MLKNLTVRILRHTTSRFCHIETKFNQNNFEILNGNSVKKFPYIWLRDNCKCPKCYNYTADEIDIDLTVIQDSIRPNKVEKQDSKLSVTWNDGHHSEYELKKFEKYFQLEEKQKLLWNKSKIQIPKYNFKDYLNSDSVLRSSLESIRSLGAVIIEGVDPDKSSVVKVCNRIGPIQNSHFGADCVVTNSLSFKDRAYTNLSLKAHTDTVYLKNSAGIEMFHVIKPAEVGGESLLVDGFYCAEQLKLNSPEDFEILTKLKVEFQFLKEGSYDLRYQSPVIDLNDDGTLNQIRFNPYHKVNVDHLSYDDIKSYYKAIRSFTRIIQNESNELWVSLNKNQVLLFDNFRVLHGRGAFKGERTLVTIYLSRDDWLSKANVLGV